MTSQVKAAVFALYSLALILGGFFLGYRYEHAALVEYKAGVEKVATKAEGKAEAINQANDKHTEETRNDYSQNLANLRGAWRVRQYPGSSAVPQVPKPPARVDEVPADALPLGGQCAETTLQLEALQEWLRGIQQ